MGMACGQSAPPYRGERELPGVGRAPEAHQRVVHGDPGTHQRAHLGVGAQVEIKSRVWKQLMLFYLQALKP